jgi:hypothetical protein
MSTLHILTVLSAPWGVVWRRWSTKGPFQPAWAEVFLDAQELLSGAAAGAGRVGGGHQLHVLGPARGVEDGGFFHGKLVNTGHLML